MKLSRIYANKSFKNIRFNEGMNIILGEVSDRENLDLDSHNLGKSILIEVIDFLLLKGVKDKRRFFLTKQAIFNEYVFFAEIKLNDGRYLIIRRIVQNNTKISFKINNKALESFDTNINNWDHTYPLDKAKIELNSYLGFDVLVQHNYRKTLNYFMRHQDDYTDVFHLKKFGKGRDKVWKPIVFDMLGFDGAVIKNKYELENEINLEKDKLKTIETENRVTTDDQDKIRGLIEIQRNELCRISEKIDKFNFFDKDNLIKNTLILDIEYQIKELNTMHYSIKYEIDKIKQALSNTCDTIDLKELQALYNEVNLIFPNEVWESYNNLIQFNKDITKERNFYLNSNLESLKTECKNVETTLKSLESQKAKLFTDLTEKTTYDKFKTYQKEIANAEANILILENKLTQINNMGYIQSTINDLEAKVQQLIHHLKLMIQENHHSNVRLLINSFTMATLKAPSLLQLRINKNNNIEFELEYRNKSQTLDTDLARGKTYKKFLCAAFDVSVLTKYIEKSFYKFAFHDGILDSLDVRKKETYLQYIRNIVNTYDLQYIITIIESEITGLRPDYIISPEEICLTLSESSSLGKLFEQDF